MGFLYQIHECAMQIYSRCCKLGERNAAICAHHEPRVFACIQLPLNPEGKVLKKKKLQQHPIKKSSGSFLVPHTLAHQVHTENLTKYTTLNQSATHRLLTPIKLDL
jgi:hypothetical protein